MSDKLDAKRFGLALGLTCALGALLLGVLAHYFGWGSLMVELIGTVYLGYDTTLPGTFIGAGWALIDGFVAGWLFAYFYNKL